MLPRGKQWIQSLWYCWVYPCVILWDSDGRCRSGLICWRLVRDAPSDKSDFNTGILRYLVGMAMLLLLGVVISSKPAADAGCVINIIILEAGLAAWKAIGNRAEMLSEIVLLALGAQYGWQLAGMMLLEPR